MSAQEWLAERLKQQGLDIYAPAGPFESFSDRLGHVIAANQYGSVVAGRHEGKPETYAQLFERAFGKPLPKLVSRRDQAKQAAS